MQKPLLQRIHIVAALVTAAGAVPGGVLAAESPATTLSQLLANSGITESGYLAASYYDSSGYDTYHQFDTSHDTFQLDQAGLQLAYQPKSGFGALVDVIAGEDAKIVDAAESAGASANSFDILQGYVQYATGPVIVQAGKFTTLAGAEVIAPTGNTSFSRSLLFFGEPLTHTGVRATYAVTGTLSLIVGVNNGWNYTKIDYGSKTGELGVAFNPDKYFSLTAQMYAGKDPVYAAERTFFDTVATFNATSALAFVVSYDWGKQQISTATPDVLSGGDWDGVAAYVNYQINNEWRVSLRGEYLDDKDGTTLLTGTRQSLEEGTLTFGYDPVASFELRFEGRYDTSSEPTFVKAESPVVQYAGDQSEIALQGVYKF
jgi:hypothetical protein